jgi:methionyl-tRNA formyltransferase
MTRVAFIGMGGAFSCEALAGAARAGRVTQVVHAAPAPGARAALGRLLARHLPALGRGDALARAAHAAGATVRPLGNSAAERDATLARLAREADLLVVAGCPHLLPMDALARFRLGAVNVHPSLLPRHRGLLPFFWTYWHGDAEGGVTAHRMVARADAGPVLARAAVPIVRGWPVAEFNAALAPLAGRVADTAVAAAARGEPGDPQDEAAATRAPRVRAGERTAPWNTWGGAHAWHFLAGLVRFHREPLRDAAGREVAYEGVGPFTAGAPPAAPGIVVFEGDAARLAVTDGAIALVGARPA